MDMAIGSSSRFAMWQLFVYAITAIVVYATAMSIAAKSVACVLILLSLFYQLGRDVLLILPGSWKVISLDSDGVSIVTRDGRTFAGSVERHTVVCQYFVLLRITPADSYLPVSRVIFPDALNDGAFRELCVRLKFS